MAYPNKVANEGDFETLLASETIPIYRRVRYIAPAGPDGVAKIALADATEKAIGVSWTPIVSGKQGLVKLASSSGDQKGITLLTAAPGDELYAAADGQITTASGGGALSVGQCKVAGQGVAGIVVYTPNR